MGERERLRTHGVPKTKERKHISFQKSQLTTPPFSRIDPPICDRSDRFLRELSCRIPRHYVYVCAVRNIKIKKYKLWSSRKGWLSVVILPAAEIWRSMRICALVYRKFIPTSYRNDVPFQGRRKEGGRNKRGKGLRREMYGKTKGGEEMG